MIKEHGNGAFASEKTKKMWRGRKKGAAAEETDGTLEDRMKALTVS